MIDERAIAERFRLLSDQAVLDERGRRLWAAAEARSAGHGGIAAVVRATGIAESTVLRGLADLDTDANPPPAGKIRRHPGRIPILVREPGLATALDRLVEPADGDPESPLRWTLKSAAALADALAGSGHKVSQRTVVRLLNDMGYSLLGNRKAREGTQRADREAQFAHINATVAGAIADGQPVISVDARRREPIADFDAAIRELGLTVRPVEVPRDAGPPPADVGRVAAHGFCELLDAQGWLSLCVTRDAASAQFAARSVRNWWEHLGRERFPDAGSLTIIADCASGSPPVTGLWKLELGRLATESGLRIRVRHFPPGTTRWTRIEHRMCSVTARDRSQATRGSREVMIALIAGASPCTGVKVYARLDDRTYPLGLTFTREELTATHVARERIRGDWNYEILPRSSSPTPRRGRPGGRLPTGVPAALGPSRWRHRYPPDRS